MISRLACTLLLSTLGLTSPALAQTDTYPDRPITIIVPFGGGGTDAISRLVGGEMAKHLDQSVVVVNRPGAGGQVATGLVANRTEADGYTVLLGSPGPLSISPALYPDLPYEPKKDLAPVARLVSVPNFFVSSTKFGAKTLDELKSLAKGQAISMGSSGIGTSHHLSGELLADHLGIEVMHVPFKSTSEVVTNMIGGQIDVAIVDSTAVPFLNKEQIHLLGITPAERSGALPDYPTLAENGATGYQATNWFGFLVPSGTPAEIIEKINWAVNLSLEAPHIKTAIQNMGMDPAPGSVQDFEEFMQADIARWEKAVKLVQEKQQ